MNKINAERLLLADIQSKGLDNYMRMQGEGRKYNNVYFCFNLKNGEQRFWTNPSEEFKKALNIDD